MLFYYLILIVIAMPIASGIAWGLPRAFRILLLSFVSFTLLAVLIVRLSQYYNTDYMHVPYMEREITVGWLCFGMWLASAGIPGAWLRQGRRISRDQVVSLLLMLIATDVWSHQPFYPMARVRRTYFIEHRPTFERLATMACEDMPADANSFIEGISGWFPGVAHFSPVRLATYRQLLNNIGLTPLDVSAQGNLGLLFLDYQAPIGYGDRAVGYVHSCSTIAMKPLVPSLDVPGPLDQTRYQALAPHWYLRENDHGPIMP